MKETLGKRGLAPAITGSEENLQIAHRMKALIKSVFAKPDLPVQTIVGIFDNARYLDKAIERLSHAGLEDTVFDEAILREQAINVDPPVFASGSAPPGVWGSAKAALPS